MKKHPLSYSASACEKFLSNCTSARETALYILNILNQGSQTLDSILDVFHEKNQKLSTRDISFFYALLYGVLRWRARLDWIINCFSKTSINKITPNVLNILRIGLFQIIYLDRVPVSAAVNTSVEITKKAAAPWVAGYVNGVLRNAVRNIKNVTFPCFKKDQVTAIATIKSFPKWLIKDWLKRFGQKQICDLCDAINTIPDITIRTNTLKTTREILGKAIFDHVENINDTCFAPQGISFSSPKIPIHETEAFKRGWFQVQDQAAQLVSIALNPMPGQTVLDACAGLGGKTGHIAGLMNNTGSLISIDNAKNKLAILKSEINRLGITNVTCREHDLNFPFTSKNKKRFDRVLLDAPCSGLGVLRRNPDTKWSSSKNGAELCAKKQIRFLDNLAGLVMPSGLLVYSVCSFQAEENENVIKVFLNRHNEFDIIPPKLPMNAKSLVSENHCIKTLPNLKSNMDGFFIVVFKRRK